MKIQFNITSSDGDLDRYADRADFLSMLPGFDGVELLCCGEDVRGILPPDKVVGLHMSSFPYWLDFWRGDAAACLREFGDAATCRAYYGGDGPEALLGRWRADLANAARYGAEYVVFHVNDCSAREAMTRVFRHSPEEVIDASCEVLNELFPADADGPLLLLENLWEPGLTFTDPALTRRLLAGVRYKNKGLMLDTGHLLHTDLSLRTQADALDYIGRMLDAHGDLCRWIRGVHLNQSLTGAYVRRVMAHPPAPAADWAARNLQMYEYIFHVDLHRPFTCPGIRALIERIAPDYLTFEFISRSRAEHRRLLRRQQRALGIAPGGIAD